MAKVQRKPVSREHQKSKPRRVAKPSQENEYEDKAAAVSKREMALRTALASAFAAPPAEAADADAYGKGGATDRLQFGYSPASAAEAVAFHSTISGAAWVAERRRLGRIAIVKRQRLARPNCEPMTSLLKLQGHWRNRAQFAAEVRGGVGVVTEDHADNLLEMLAAQQRTA